MTAYYISGPMRGKPDYNYAQFNDVARELKKELGADHQVINPAANFDGDTSLRVSAYMNLDLKQVLESDALILLPGWRESEGARREVQLALWAGKDFYDAFRNPDGDWCFQLTDISAPSVNPSVRADMLDEAKALITGDRNSAYGPPSQDFTRTAGALSAMGYRGPGGRDVQAHDIAIMVMMVKLSRLMWTPAKRDSWVDIAGYAGCGLECALEEESERLAA